MYHEIRHTTCGNNIALAIVTAYNNNKPWNAYQLTIVVAICYVQRVKMINLRQLSHCRQTISKTRQQQKQQWWAKVKSLTEKSEWQQKTL